MPCTFLSVFLFFHLISMDIGHLRAFNRFTVCAALHQYWSMVILVHFFLFTDSYQELVVEWRNKKNSNIQTDFLSLVQWPLRCPCALCTNDGNFVVQCAVCTASHLCLWSMDVVHTTWSDRLNKKQQMKATASAHFYLLLILPVFCEQIASSRRAAPYRDFFSFYFSIITYFH